MATKTRVIRAATTVRRKDQVLVAQPKPRTTSVQIGKDHHSFADDESAVWCHPVGNTSCGAKNRKLPNVVGSHSLKTRASSMRGNRASRNAARTPLLTNEALRPVFEIVMGSRSSLTPRASAAGVILNSHKPMGQSYRPDRPPLDAEPLGGARQQQALVRQHMARGSERHLGAQLHDNGHECHGIRPGG